MPPARPEGRAGGPVQKFTPQSTSMPGRGKRESGSGPRPPPPPGARRLAAVPVQHPAIVDVCGREETTATARATGGAGALKS